MILQIDKWVLEGKFKRRSDAIRTILALYQEKEKTHEFCKILVERSNEAKENPEILTLLEDLDDIASYFIQRQKHFWINEIKK